jgi:hypothetical protein
MNISEKKENQGEPALITNLPDKHTKPTVRALYLAIELLATSLSPMLSPREVIAKIMPLAGADMR